MVIKSLRGIVVLGSGGRESAIFMSLWNCHEQKGGWSIWISPKLVISKAICEESRLNRYPSYIETQATDETSLSWFKENGIELVVPGSEVFFASGIVDVLQGRFGITVFGPSFHASQLEWSKSFAKQFMADHCIKTAPFRVFSDYKTAAEYICSRSDHNQKYVIKVSGLAAGKGVVIPHSLEESLGFLAEIFNSSVSIATDAVEGEKSKVVIEEFIKGKEISFFALCDGYTVRMLPSAQDHKRIWDDDKGKNTGGMGAIAPSPLASPELYQKARKLVIEPTINGMRKSSRSPYRGILYAGCIISEDEDDEDLYLLEYNCRWGDPEAQSILSLFPADFDWIEVLLDTCREPCLDRYPENHFLKATESKFAVNVVMSAAGYPEPTYRKGDVIHVKDEEQLGPLTKLFYAGVRENPETKEIFTNGGRVLSVCSVSNLNYNDAVDRVYSIVGKSVTFEEAHFRKDIGKRLIGVPKSKKQGLTYEMSGVSIDSGNTFVNCIKDLVRENSKGASTDNFGGFAGIFDLEAGSQCDRRGILLACTDGVGTKLKIAFSMNQHDSIGIDLVAMSVNDLIVQGVEPLFFLDYFGTGKLDLETSKSVMKGIVLGCSEAGAQLLGGETAEMPGIYGEGEYDLAGFAVGWAPSRKVLFPRSESIKEGDLVLGIASSGFHANGYSLIRKIISQTPGLLLTDKFPFSNERIGDYLLRPTRIYVKSIKSLLSMTPNHSYIKGFAHITGGGLEENVPRIFNATGRFKVQYFEGSWQVPPEMTYFGELGNVSKSEMFRVWNLGIGMVVVVDKAGAHSIKQYLESIGETVNIIGQIVNQ